MSNAKLYRMNSFIISVKLNKSEDKMSQMSGPEEPTEPTPPNGVSDLDRDPVSGAIDESSAYHPTDPGTGPAPDDDSNESGG
jgi:hypothetical protein